MKHNYLQPQPIPWFRRRQFLIGLMIVGALFLVAGISFQLFFPKQKKVATNLPSSSSVADDERQESLKFHESLESIEQSRQDPSWNFIVKKGNQATVETIQDTTAVTRVNITQVGTGNKWDIQLNWQPLVVRGNEWYSLRFRARADDLRSMRVQVTQMQAPHEKIGRHKTIPLMRKWQNYELELLSTIDDTHAKVQFALGATDVPVEIADVKLLQLSYGAPKWRLNLAEATEAELVVPPINSEGIRVAISQTDSKRARHIQLIQKPLTIQANEHYRMTFQVKADAPRHITVGMSQTEYPWESLGLEQEIALTSEWQDVALEFVGSKSARQSQLYFNLGGSLDAVEIKEVSLQHLFSRTPLWHLEVKDGSHAELVKKPEDPDHLQVAISLANSASPEHIQLTRWPLDVEAEGRYMVRFQARAHVPRSMIFGISTTLEGNRHNLGLNTRVELTQQWKDVEKEFVATKADANAQLYFDLGERAVYVDLAAVSIERLAHGPRTWRLMEQVGNKAKLKFLPEDPEVVRVIPMMANTATSDDIQLHQGPIVLQENHVYTLGFRARADNSRSINLRLQKMEGNTMVSLGIQGKFPLTPEWQVFEKDFFTTDTIDHAHVLVDLGGSSEAVEITAVKFYRKSEILLGKFTPSKNSILIDSVLTSKE